MFPVIRLLSSGQTSRAAVVAKNEDYDFEKTVAKFLSEGLHTRRGLSAEEYTSVCRKAWTSVIVLRNFLSRF
jgi:hypothetical protein